MFDRILKRLEDRIVVFCRSKRETTWLACVHDGELFLAKGQTIFKLGKPEDVVAKFKDELTGSTL